MTTPTDDIEAFFLTAAARIDADPTWRADFAASAPEFFPLGRAPDDSDGARRRHLEWFLLERAETDGPELALPRALATILADEASPEEAWFVGLRETHTGVFEVTGAQAGEGFWLRDLGGRGEFPIAHEAASQIAHVGDVIAGRIFPLGDGVYHLSSAAAFHRDPELVDALRADFERARTERRGVLRVGQRQIEAMFFGVPEDDYDAVAAARAFLADSGLDALEIDTFLEDLEAAPFDEDRLLHGAQDVLSEILDGLAFESSIDIDAARRALLAAWAQLARRGPGVGPSLSPHPSPHAGPAPQADVARAVARFEERRRTGEPVATLLDELERELELGDGGDGDGGADPIPDFPGVVGAMVEEFLWETSTREGESGASRHANLRDLGRSAEHVGVFENLRARDLLVYAGWWLPENDTLGGADDARARIASLADFCRWAEGEHEVPLHTDFQATLVRLGTTLPRIAEANQRRTRGARRDEGELFEVVSIEADGAGQLQSRSGMAHEAIVESELAHWLRPGDRVRGALREDRRLAVYCCYPPEVGGLVEAGAN